jgi:hypothetical protein
MEPGMGQLLVVGSLGAGQRPLERRRRGIAQIIALVDEGRAEFKAGEELPSLTAEGIVGGAVAIVHARLVGEKGTPLLALVNPLMSMIVMPYLGPAAARKELERAVPKSRVRVAQVSEHPLRDLDMRLTYRTVRVLMSVGDLGEHGSYPSNREVGEAAGIADQGQISKLLGRLTRLGLIHNKGLAPGKGAPNAWALTAKGQQLERVMRTDSDREPAKASARSRG